jgi:hypothetical protein
MVVQSMEGNNVTLFNYVRVHLKRHIVIYWIRGAIVGASVVYLVSVVE